MVIVSTRNVGDIKIINSEFLGSREKSYVAEKDNYTAHGKTVKEAVADLKFKIMSETMSKGDIVEDIKSTGKVTVGQYRLLTGACQMGCDHFLNEHNVKVTEMPIDEAKELIKGAYGSDQFLSLIN